MKTLLLAGVTLSLLCGSAAQAQPGHRWGRGQRLPRAYYQDRRYAVDDWRARRLPPPRRGYRWVRRDNNYLMVAATTGLIASVIAASR